MGIRIALFGQAAFGRDVFERLVARGHAVVGVYTPPETRRPDPLAEASREHGVRLHQVKHFRRRRGDGFEPIAHRIDEYRALDADLNVLAFVTAILPPEIVDAPPRRSLCFHPSLLPRYRGGNALAWQIIRGERESGVTVFQPDAGVDTGPIVVQKGGVSIEAQDTAGSLYFEKLYSLGVDAVAEAVDAVAAGTARFAPQDEALASFQGLVGDSDARVDWSRPAVEVDRLLRGCDPQPGAWALLGGDSVRLFDCRLAGESADAPPGSVLGFEDGAAHVAAAGGCLRVGRVRVGDGPKQPARDGLVLGSRLC